MGPCTLCNLPTELKVIILSQFGREPGSRYALRSCSRVCTCLRAVAVEFVFNKHLAATVSSPEEVLALLDKHPRVGAKLLGIRIAGRNAAVPLAPSRTTVDHALLCRLVALAPRMDTLTLCNLRIDAPSRPRQCGRQSPDHLCPRPLKRLTVRMSSPGSSVDGTLRILSMFKVEHCSLEAPLIFDPCDATPLTHTLSVRSLSIGSCGAALLDGLAQILVPGVLKSFTVKCNSSEAIRAAGRLLEQAGQGLVSLTVSPDAHHREFEQLKDDPHGKQGLMLPAR